MVCTVLRPLLELKVDLKKLARLMRQFRRIPAPAASEAAFETALLFARRYAITKDEAHALVFLAKTYKRSLRRKRNFTCVHRGLGFAVEHRATVAIFPKERNHLRTVVKH